MSNYSIVHLDQSNLHHLYTLYQSVYEKKMPDNYFHKKYSTAYTGVSHLGFFVFHNDVAVSYSGLIPVVTSIKNARVLAAQPSDVMTHPDFQKKGLYVELMTQTLDLAKSLGVQFVFGFPNQNSHQVSVDKLGFVHKETMNRYTWSLKDTFIKKVARKFPVKYNDSDRSLIKNEFIEQGHDGVIYDREYLSYKKCNKNFVVKIDDHALWLNHSNGLWVGAINPIFEREIENKIDQLQKKFRASSVTLMLSPGTQTDKLLSATKTPENGYSVIVKDLTGKYAIENLKFQFADVEMF